MLDAYAANFKVVDNLVLGSKIPHNLRESGRFDILVRSKMIRNQGYFRIVKNRTVNLLKFLDGRRRGNIIGQYHVFSHIEWQMTGWEIHLEAPIAVCEQPSSYCEPVDAAPDLTSLDFVTLSELHNKYSVPAAFQYYLT